ncbi:hypothetical protein A8990_11495 [Paenibacillus taihuensis]|uniref:Uncharacterized protein n=1 Tax=Paenibacillus taihuensis TaxID=1156355 RepID=A0A3D9RX63_9BACL|nr:hypothetical protein [Paenibacillus taihuensis]REE84560.1 hypothetical protein A8990_11495 [Paenibacillus taihuensis]
MDEQYINVEENVVINSLYLAIVLNKFGKAKLEELAIAVYLFRFTNVLVSLLEKQNMKSYMRLCQESDLQNLDSLLSPYLVNIYNDRFQRSLSELLARDMIQRDKNDDFFINFDAQILINLINELELNLVDERFNIIVQYIRSNEVSVIKQKIYGYSGELIG